MSETFPVYVQVPSSDGLTQRVQIGVAQRQADGFLLQMGNWLIGNTPVAAPSRTSFSAASGPSGDVFPNYGRSKGAPIRGATLQDLEYYANGARRSLGDASKARFHDKERALLAAIEAEISRQQASSGMGGDNLGEGSMGMEPPPHGDEDVPF